MVKHVFIIFCVSFKMTVSNKKTTQNLKCNLWNGPRGYHNLKYTDFLSPFILIFLWNILKICERKSWKCACVWVELCMCIIRGWFFRWRFSYMVFDRWFQAYLSIVSFVSCRRTEWLMCKNVFVSLPFWKDGY